MLHSYSSVAWADVPLEGGATVETVANWPGMLDQDSSRVPSAVKKQKKYVDAKWGAEALKPDSVGKVLRYLKLLFKEADAVPGLEQLALYRRTMEALGKSQTAKPPVTYFLSQLWVHTMDILEERYPDGFTPHFYFPIPACLGDGFQKAMREAIKNSRIPAHVLEFPSESDAAAIATMMDTLVIEEWGVRTYSGRLSTIPSLLSD